MKLGIVELYCGKSGKKGYYNSQELGLAKAMARLGVECVVFYPDMQAEEIRTENISQGVTMVLVPAKGIGVHARFRLTVTIRYSHLFSQSFVRSMASGGIITLARLAVITLLE
ncbi:MAG: hypothetical protein Q4B72_12420 [Lachnospiraceae bacterium]|nr:hypothetical protein [Lachnospiraceae bacterium]